MSQGVLLDLLLRPGSLRAEFQPVVDVTAAGGPVHYLEGLIRGPRDTNVEKPEVLFGYARRKHAEAEVDRAALATILEAARDLPAVSVAANVHTATLAADLDFLGFLGEQLSRNGIEPERLILELVEHGEPWDPRALLLNLEGLRSIGVRVALDDFGTGQANYAMLLDCAPDYLKIDRHFIHGCCTDPRRQVFVESLARLAVRIGSKVVAEGVENPADLIGVRQAGMGLAQGFLLGRPEPVSAWPLQRPSLNGA
jgi:EAL domain-containing protein (putative c-di-GMP-specific phosphodiesterase class I)